MHEKWQIYNPEIIYFLALGINLKHTKIESLTRFYYK